MKQEVPETLPSSTSNSEDEYHWLSPCPANVAQCSRSSEPWAYPSGVAVGNVPRREGRGGKECQEMALSGMWPPAGPVPARHPRALGEMAGQCNSR